MTLSARNGASTPAPLVTVIRVESQGARWSNPDPPTWIQRTDRWWGIGACAGPGYPGCLTEKTTSGSCSCKPLTTSGAVAA